MYARFLKRVIDLVVAALGLLLFAPVLILLAVVTRTSIGSPVIFQQVRPGRGGELFALVKFRTMSDKRDPTGALLPDSDRLPRIGRWLRSTSLDELPELWNVLRGDMSLVGPRPLLPQYLPLYSPHQARRHEVRPGITGWAQVNGRNALSWPQKFEMDVWYVDHLTFALDLKILVRTLATVISRRGVTDECGGSASPFAGV
jgi:lipopolysaccharide/colanic/teichoic acid biosynthesis glycosyltransferase